MLIPKFRTEYEDAAVHIQRRFVGYRFKNGTEWKDEEALSIPFVVIFTESKRWFDGDNRPTTRMIAIACTVLVLLGSLVAVVYTFRGIFLVASPVDGRLIFEKSPVSYRAPMKKLVTGARMLSDQKK
uniref:CX domain-containing protein n=1 Tax=Caenorhabditis tropicalis TaxID=1561998 RepID=A0A1I7UD60_9PELO